MAARGRFGRGLLDIKGPVKRAIGQTWDIITDMDPETITAVGLKIAEKWIRFALGAETLGGKMLMHPTGRYASSIRFQQTGQARVAIIADEKKAPEGAILEEGHGAIDLKQTMFGKTIPLFRGTPGQYGSAGYGAPILDTTPMGRRKNVWAQPRAQGYTGMRTVGRSGWVIPPMPAYSPAAHMVDLLKLELEK
jgi:hypothetical protein